MKNFVNPSSDMFIKYLLGSEKNSDLLLSFINAVTLDSNLQKITTVEIKNPFNIKNFPVDKESILDVKATDEKGRQYDIEVQSIGNKNFKIRSLYYWAKLYSSQLQESDIYIKLKPAICINVLNFTLFEDIESIHNCFLLREINNPEYVLTDHLVIHFLELPKLEDEIKRDKLLRWLLFLKNEGRKEELMQILIKEDEDIRKAHQEYEHFTQDEELRELYEARLKWQMDHNTDIEIARQEGIEEGKVEDAKKMLKDGLKIDLIEKYTGLSIDEIKKISNRSRLQRLQKK